MANFDDTFVAATAQAFEIPGKRVDETQAAFKARVLTSVRMSPTERENTEIDELDAKAEILGITARMPHESRVSFEARVLTSEQMPEEDLEKAKPVIDIEIAEDEKVLLPFVNLPIPALPQQELMVYGPDDGESRPWPSHAAQWRLYHGDVTAWLYNPWSGTQRDARDVGSDPFGFGISP